MSAVCSYAGVYFDPHKVDIRKIVYRELSLKLVATFQFWLQLNKNGALYEKRKCLYEYLRTL
jgi:hypothetical protein